MAVTGIGTAFPDGMGTSGLGARCNAVTDGRDERQGAHFAGNWLGFGTIAEFREGYVVQVVNNDRS